MWAEFNSAHIYIPLKKSLETFFYPSISHLLKLFFEIHIYKVEESSVQNTVQCTGSLGTTLKMIPERTLKYSNLQIVEDQKNDIRTFYAHFNKAYQWFHIINNKLTILELFLFFSMRSRDSVLTFFATFTNDF